MADEQSFTSELGDRFETALIKAVPAFEGLLVTGLSDLEIDSLSESLPGALPFEVRQWWKWHNGVSFPPLALRPVGLPHSLGRGKFMFDSLEAALSSYQDLQQLAHEDAPGHEEEFAPSKWFPLEAGRSVSIEVTSDPVETSKVIYTDAWYPEYGQVVAPTLGAFVLWWTEALENGGLKYSADAGWTVDESLVDSRLTGLSLA